MNSRMTSSTSSTSSGRSSTASSAIWRAVSGSSLMPSSLLRASAERQGAFRSGDGGGGNAGRRAEGRERRLVRQDEMQHAGEKARLARRLPDLRRLDAGDADEAPQQLLVAGDEGKRRYGRPLRLVAGGGLVSVGTDHAASDNPSR